jgi:glycine dehydrogenase
MRDYSELFARFTEK